MKKIEAIIVDGIVYDVVKSEDDMTCHNCALAASGDCFSWCNCICGNDEYFKRRETK